MDRENLLIIESLGNRRKEPGRATVQLLSHFLDDSWPTDVPDPYEYTDEAGYMDSYEPSGYGYGTRNRSSFEPLGLEGTDARGNLQTQSGK